MTIQSEIDQLNERLTMLVKHTCSQIGCADCPFIDGAIDNCMSDKLQDQILKLEYEQTQGPKRIS